MTIKLTPASFLLCVRQSGLVDLPRLESALAELDRQHVDQNDTTGLAQGLVQLGVLTEWQAEKLLQGRHKGFILGRYKLLSLLGAGEMSAVYLAEHTLLERRCAIKVLPGNKVKDTSYLGRFHREAKAVALLNHPNIVRAYDVDQQFDSGSEIHFLVMEFVEGENIERIVSEKGPLDFAQAADYIRQAADGLGHAHQAGMVHRDIKPENLLIDNSGVVKILDLGLARFFKQTDEESLTIKHDEKVLGTADYLAPEQAIDSHKVDARADIYSLGCTFYFALTGHPPFTEGTLVQRLFAHQTKTPRPVTDDRPDAPVSLLTIIEKMMAKKAAERYQTAAELVAALTRWLVENTGDDWKRSHLSLVASVMGMESLSKQRLPRNESGAPVTQYVPAQVSSSSNTTLGRLSTRDVENTGPVPEMYSPPANPPSRLPATDNSPSVQPINRSTDRPASAPTPRPRQDSSEPLQRDSDIKRRLKTKSSAAQPTHQRDGGDTSGTKSFRSRTSQSEETSSSESTRQRATEEDGLFSWLYSSNPMHVQTRQLIGWILLVTVALICFFMMAFWIFQTPSTTENPSSQTSEKSTPAAVIEGNEQPTA